MTKIYISPSVQGNNKGVGKYGTEKDRMNKLADLIVPLLKKQGFTVYRNKPTMSLAQIVADSNSKKPDSHVSLHSNAGGGEGTEVWYYQTSTKGKKLAQTLYDEVAKVSPARDRGIKPSKVLMELKNTTAPTALIEYMFHDNEDDVKHFLANMDKYAEATVKGICNYYGQTYKKDTKKETTKKMYRVQVGAFTDKKNAENFARNVTRAGFPTVIKYD